MRDWISQLAFICRALDRLTDSQDTRKCTQVWFHLTQPWLPLASCLTSLLCILGRKRPTVKIHVFFKVFKRRGKSLFFFLYFPLRKYRVFHWPILFCGDTWLVHFRVLAWGGQTVKNLRLLSRGQIWARSKYEKVIARPRECTRILRAKTCVDLYGPCLVSALINF